MFCEGSRKPVIGGGAGKACFEVDKPAKEKFKEQEL